MERVCLDPETIAAFAEGTLPAVQRKQVEAHVASCDDCLDTLAGLRSYLREKQPRPWIRPAWVGLAASLVLAAGLGGYVATHRRPPSSIHRLVEVAMADRAIDARMMGGFRWTPLAPIERSGTGRATRSESQLREAAARIEAEVAKAPTPENRQALGVARLFEGKLDEAIELLRSAAADAPAKASPLSDLGAALLARGELRSHPRDLMDALSTIDQALAQDTTLEEGLFNKAVALEKLGLAHDAQTAWRDYLSHASESAWSDEARTRLERLERAGESSEWEPDRETLQAAAERGSTETLREIVPRRTQETRLWIQDGLLVSWARAANEGRPADAARALATALALSTALFETTRDPMTRDAVMAVEAEAATPRRETLIRGLLAYASGVDHDARFEMEQARPRFEEAAAALAAAGNPLALYASFAVARCRNYEADWERGRPGLERVLAEAEQRGYVALVAHAAWVRGLFDSKSSRLSESLASYQTSLRLFERMREEEHAAFVSALMAEDLGFLGDEPGSQRRIFAALARLPRVRTASRRIVILTHAAIAAGRAQLPDVAWTFENAAVDIAGVDGDAIDRADSLQRRAAFAIQLGRFEIARADLIESRAWVDRIADAELRARLDAELLAADGQLARLDADPGRAIALLSRAIGYFSSAKFDVRLPDLFLERARASRAGSDPVQAERDLQAGIDLLEKHRTDVFPAGDRVSYFDTAHGLFREMVALEISRSHTDEALAFLERGKARDLLDRWHPAADLDLQDLPHDVPRGVALIVFGVLPDRLLVWALLDGRREVAQESIGADELTVLVRGFRAELEGARGEEVPETARRLFDVLLLPILDRIAGASTWVFVPDEILHAVPFSALADRRTGRFLVQDHAVLVTPSIALFLHATRRSPPDPREKAELSLLAIGDPAFDEDTYPDLPRLSAAAGEAQSIASLYADPVVLTDASATPTAFLREITHHSVVHFAGHALTNDADPLRSRLVLAVDPERSDSGNLFAETLYALSFPRVRLVILAACATASGRLSSAEGPLSLARPFLSGGVPAVVATLWDIEDAPSAKLLLELHRGIAAGMSPEDALRKAQLGRIEGSDVSLRAPRIWAAFQLAGGVRPTGRV